MTPRKTLDYDFCNILNNLANFIWAPRKKPDRKKYENSPNLEKKTCLKPNLTKLKHPRVCGGLSGTVLSEGLFRSAFIWTRLEIYRLTDLLLTS